jgi:hypothetical protein
MRARPFIAFLVLILAAASPLPAQENTETRLDNLEQRLSALEGSQEGAAGHSFLLSGYANAQIVEPEEGPSTFSAVFAPIFLFKSGHHVLFQSEIELTQEGETTLLEIEYAKLDYMHADYAVLSAGKFLLPLGTFGERGHPSWINKLPTPPIIYSGHGGSAAAIIPVMSDYGVQLRGGVPTGGWRWSYALYAVNGPRPVTAAAEDEHEAETPVNYEASTEDDNQNKAYGFRVGVLPSAGLEFGWSYYSGGVTYRKFIDEMSAPGAQADNPIRLTMFDFAFVRAPLHFKGEYLIEDSSALDDYVMDTMTDESGMTITEPMEVPGERAGYWAEIAYALGGVFPELVLRYGSSSVDGEEIGSQAAAGMDWWLDPSLVLKLAAVSNTMKNGASESLTDYYVAMAMGF